METMKRKILENLGCPVCSDSRGVQEGQKCFYFSILRASNGDPQEQLFK